MVHISVIEARLSQMGLRVSKLFKPEVQELQKILVEGEELVHVVPGRYFGGFALLAATDRRLILVDKKVAVLATEIIPYDMISEVDFGARMMDATLVLFTVNKQHRFTCLKHRLKLREMTNYIQQRVMELRYSQSAMPPAPAVDSQQAYAPVPNAPSAFLDTWQRLAHPRAPHFSQKVGAVVVHHARWPLPNPYTQTSFMMKNQSYGTTLGR